MRIVLMSDFVKRYRLYAKDWMSSHIVAVHSSGWLCELKLGSLCTVYNRPLECWQDRVSDKHIICCDLSHISIQTYDQCLSSCPHLCEIVIHIIDGSDRAVTMVSTNGTAAVRLWLLGVMLLVTCEGIHIAVYIPWGGNRCQGTLKILPKEL